MDGGPEAGLPWAAQAPMPQASCCAAAGRMYSAKLDPSAGIRLAAVEPSSLMAPAQAPASISGLTKAQRPLAPATMRME